MANELGVNLPCFTAARSPFTAQGGATPKRNSDEQLKLLCSSIRPASATTSFAATRRRLLTRSPSLDGDGNVNYVSPRFHHH